MIELCNDKSITINFFQQKYTYKNKLSEIIVEKYNSLIILLIFHTFGWFKAFEIT